MEAESPVSEESERPRRRRRQPPPPPEPQGSPVKGAILVVVAVVIGLLLRRDDSSSTAQVAVGAEDDPAVVDESDTTSSTTSTTAAPRPPADVKVLVANGSGVNGAAGAQTTELEALGYVTASPTDAERVTATVVYFTDTYQPEAEALATAIGADPAAVAPLPTPAPVGDTQLSNLIVVLGPDLATSG